jgi:hypothetical protein
MKLATLAALAFLLAAVFTAAAPGSSPSGRAACNFATLPRAAAAGEQSLYGRIGSLRRSNGHYVLRFDPAFLLTGMTANRAALEDTGSSDVPNDNYTVDESHRLLVFPVPASAKVTVLTHATCSTATTVARLARSVRPTQRFWIQIHNGTVRSIDEQYHP